jgi:hypothetical protein
MSAWRAGRISPGNSRVPAPPPPTWTIFTGRGGGGAGASSSAQASGPKTRARADAGRRNRSGADRHLARGLTTNLLSAAAGSTLDPFEADADYGSPDARVQEKAA